MSIEEEIAAIEKKYSGAFTDPTGMKAGMEIAKMMGIKNFHIQEEMLSEIKTLRLAIEKATGGQQ